MNKFLLILVLVIASCQAPTSDPGVIQTADAQTRAAQPSPTFTATNTPIPTPTLEPTATTEPQPVVYYYFVMLTGSPLPSGSVVILADELVLAPMLTNKLRSSDIVANLTFALNEMIGDPDNVWTSSDLEIDNIIVDEGAVQVFFRGSIFAPGDIVLIAARMQMLMTVFAEPSVQAATITINGKNIANLGVSRESEISPDNYAYSRTEIETFMQHNASEAPK